MSVSSRFFAIGFSAIVVSLQACSSAPSPSKSASAPSALLGVDGQPCVGGVDAAPDGAVSVEDATLLASSRDAAGKGKLCAGTVFEAKKNIPVYRVWNSAKPYTEIGRWWSLSRPAGPVDKYREQNAICPEWSDLDVVSVCEIKAGSHFVMGPGQSAKCEGNREYPRSVTNQVYIDNDTREKRVFVDNCKKLGSWP